MMNKTGNVKIFLLLGIAGTLGVLMNGCQKDNSTEKAAKEQQDIDTYLAYNGISKDTKTADGIYYVEREAGTGDTLKAGDYMVIDFTGKNLDGTVIETTDSTTAADAGIYNQIFIYHPLKIRYGYSLPGINIGLSYMREGGKATLIIPSSLANQDYNPLVYNIELLRVIKNPSADARNELNTYLSGLDSTKYNINGEKVTPGDSTSTGIYYIMTDNDPSQTDKIETGDSVYIAFTAYFTDGKTFDHATADHPYAFIYGILNNLPTGVSQAVGLMNEGTKARVIIPYYMGYGINPVYYNHMLIVPAYSTIIYDIELLRRKSNS